VVGSGRRYIWRAARRVRTRPSAHELHAVGRRHDGVACRHDHRSARASTTGAPRSPRRTTPRPDAPGSDGDQMTADPDDGDAGHATGTYTDYGPGCARQPRCKSGRTCSRVARDSAAQYPRRPARTPPIPQAAICPGSDCTAAYTAAPALKTVTRIETPPREIEEPAVHRCEDAPPHGR
jgi:hypothetical protein